MVYPKVYLDEDDVARHGLCNPGNSFAQLPNTVDFCFVIDAVYYKLKAEVFVKTGYTVAATTVTPVQDQQPLLRFKTKGRPANLGTRREAMMIANREAKARLDYRL